MDTNDEKFLEVEHINKSEADLYNDSKSKNLGTRWLTKKPKLIGLIIVIGFIAFIIFASNYQGAGIIGRKKDSAKQPGWSEQTANQLIFDMPDGYIVGEKAEPQVKAKTPETTTIPDVKPQTNNRTIPITSYNERPPVQAALTEDEINILRYRRQTFEQGLVGKTAVSTNTEQLRQNVAAQSGSRGNAPADTNETLNRLNAAKQNLAAMAASANNGTDQFLQQLSTLRGGTGAAATSSGFGDGANLGYTESSTSNNTSTSSGSDRWLLDAGGKPQPPRSLCEVRAGTVIPAIMVSGINSDLPGQIIAQVSQDVYDTATGRYMVIPQGTKLVGSYNNDISFGQERVLMVWQRLVYPDGRALDLGSMPGTDQAGYAGLTDIVETHFWRTMGAAFMMSLVIAGVEISQDDLFRNSNTNTQRAGDSLSEALGQTMGNTMSQFIQQYMTIQTTIIIRPGNLLNVMVTKDIPFEKPYQEFNYN